MCQHVLKYLQICCKLDNAYIHVCVRNSKAHIDFACRLTSRRQMSTGTVLEKVTIKYHALTPAVAAGMTH